MRILIDIGHPAHVHLFRNMAAGLEKKGHTTLFTYREKECSGELLKYYNLNFVRVGENYKSFTGKIFGILKTERKLFKASRKFRPDIFISHGSFYAAWVAFLLKKPHIALEDTGNMEQVRLYRPFSAAVLTSTSFKKKISPKQLFYPGYHELAYLHPKYFVPDQDFMNELTENGKQRIILLRFVQRSASHDKGYKNITNDLIMMMVNRLNVFGRIIISSEFPLNGVLSKYGFSAAAGQFQQTIAASSLVIGNSATVASEAAMCGVPAILIDNDGRFYTDELENKYGLVCNFKETEEGIDEALKTAINLLENEAVKEEWQQKKEVMLAGTIDLTGFLIWFLEGFPGSFEQCKNDTDCFNKIKLN